MNVSDKMAMIDRNMLYSLKIGSYQSTLADNSIKIDVN